MNTSIGSTKFHCTFISVLLKFFPMDTRVTCTMGYGVGHLTGFFSDVKGPLESLSK